MRAHSLFWRLERSDGASRSRSEKARSLCLVGSVPNHEPLPIAPRPRAFNPVKKCNPEEKCQLQGGATLVRCRVLRTLVNERYRFFYRGNDESVCLVSKIDI